MSRQFTGQLTEEDEKFLKQRKPLQQVQYLMETAPLVEDETEVDPASEEKVADDPGEKKTTSAKK